MKITIVTGPWLPVPALRGGAMQKSWHALGIELGKLGQDVTIVARSYPGQRAEESIGGVRFLRPRGFSQSGRIGLDLAKDFLYSLNVLPRLPLADFLITNSFWLPVLAAPLRGNAGAVIISAARYPKGQYRLYRGAKRVLAISSAVRDAVEAEQPALGDRTLVLPLPVDFARLAGVRSGPRGGRRTLLYAGRIHPEKGIELLLRAFRRISARFPEWRLRFVGPEAESEGGGGVRFSAKMRELSQPLPVDWSGPIWDPEKLASAYAEAELFVYPSLAEKGEAFGVAALESMAAGVPPIVSSLACFRDFVREGVNGWFFDHRSSRPDENLAATMARAMVDDDLRRVCGVAARETAAGFEAPRIAADLVALLERARPPG